jgi:hypothetical protein
MIKILKKNGLLDADFIQALPLFILPILLKVLGV